MPLSELDFPPARFDAIFFSSTVYPSLQGKRNRIDALARCACALRPGGRLMLPVTVSEEPLLAELLIDAPRRVLRRALGKRLGARVLEPGDRFVRSWPDAPALSYQHRFSADEASAELSAAGLAPLGRMSDYFVFGPSPGA
jgi:hypothetical protein